MSFPLARLRLLLAVLVLSLMAVACSTEQPSLGEDEGASSEVDVDEAPTTTTPDVTTRTLRLAVGTDWSGDPADAGPASVGKRLIAGLLHEGLTSIGPDGTPDTGLAERWFVSEDRRQWTFVLPDGLTDGLGTPLTARDIKTSFERLADRGPYDQLVAALTVVEGWSAFVAGDTASAAGIIAIDDTTLVVSLDAPYEPLLELLAAPGYGVTGTTADGDIRTTGDYRATTDPNWLEAVDPAAVVDRIELVRSDGNGGALLASRRVDFAVLAPDDGGSEVRGDVLRQPLDLRVGVAARFDELAVRTATLAALQPTVLAANVSNGTVDVSGSLEPAPESLPAAITVHIPAGELEPLGAAIAAQLTAAGVDVSAVVLSAPDFADAVASGEATLFPMLSAGGLWSQSAGLAVAEPGGIDDVFGVTADARAELVDAIRADPDPVARASLVNALERLLLEEGLLLPVATFEVLVGVGEDMDSLRIRADGTLDLSRFSG